MTEVRVKIEVRVKTEVRVRRAQALPPALRVRQPRTA
jgi:hypothetical protein